MPEIRVQFVCENSIGSQIISWFGAGHLSHVDLVIPEGLDWRLPSEIKKDAPAFPVSGDLMGARVPGGVAVRPPDYAKFTHRVVMMIPVTNAEWIAFWDFARAQLGKKYDWLAILAFLFNRDWRDRNRWYCSELLLACLEARPRSPRYYLAANKVTPNAAALLLSGLQGAAYHVYS